MTDTIDQRPDRQSLKLLLRDRDAVTEARRQQLVGLKGVYPVGSYCRFKAGKFVGAGLVTGHHLSFPIVFVMKPGAKIPVSVNVSMIIDLLESEDATL